MKRLARGLGRQEHLRSLRIEDLPASLAEHRVKDNQVANGKAPGLRVPLPHKRISLEPRELLTNPCDILPRARRILVGIQPRLLEVFRVDPEPIARQLAGDSIDLAAVGVTAQAAPQPARGQIAVRRGLEYLEIDGSQETRRHVAREKAVEEVENIRSGSPGHSGE